MNPPNTAAQTERTAQALKKTSGLFRAAAMSNGFAEHANQLETDLSSALAQLRQAREDKEIMRRALEDARAGFIDLAKTLEQYRKRASRDVALAYACDVGRALTTTAPKEKP